MKSSIPSSVDVLVVGGGPTGLLTTSILLQSGVKVLAVEKYDKLEQASYGRACVLFAGSLELLDKYGIYDRIADTGFIIRGATTFKDGELITNRGWGFVHKALEGNTDFDFSMTIRQKYIEDAMRSAISELDSEALKAPARLVKYHETGLSEYPIIATVDYEGTMTEVACKYLVGADGGRSTIRSLGNFSFPGTSSVHKWVRLDATVRTDMPSSRSKSIALESRSYGNVLWLPIDNRRTRIGFVCPDALYGTDGSNITDADIMAIAKEAVKPFTLEFITLDWWTVYAIGQRVADKYKDGHVILAGDAAHTHSSGAAQGMNTGIHDASNLAWKLAGVTLGLYTEDILDTYATERRASAQHLIQLDRDISTLISGKLPSRFADAGQDIDVNDCLELVQSQNVAFTTGLGVSYGANMLNWVPEGEAEATSEKAGVRMKIGHRAFDVPLYRPGAAYPKPLRSFMPYGGARFWILVFAGRLAPAFGDADQLSPAGLFLPPRCADRYRMLREYMDSSRSFTHTLRLAFEFLTILRLRPCGEGGGGTLLPPTEAIGARPLGKTVYDRSGGVFSGYGVDEGEGGIVVVRPDGVVCYTAPLDGGAHLARYFSVFVRQSRGGGQSWLCEEDSSFVAAAIARGEVSVEGQEELAQSPW